MIRFNAGMKACGIFLLWATTAVVLPAQTFTTLQSFNGRDGKYPVAGLVQGTDGNFYGTTSYGANGYGTVFKITQSGNLRTLHSFDIADGYAPAAGLVQGTNGEFYGTTYGGGASNYGTVFRITLSGKLTTVHSFDGTDGSAPAASLIQATDGNFYGTTIFGGANGDGTVFKIAPNGNLTILHSFDGTDGQSPLSALVQATNGDFYGTTGLGGAYGGGSVFEITSNGTLTTLYSFCLQSGCTDGASPSAGLVQATNGDFYGTAFNGGANGAGTVFKVTPNGTLTTLHNFDGTDGNAPEGTLIQATDGNFYGTTYFGGAGSACGSGAGCGTVFKITPRGTLRTLHSFCSQSDCTDGYYPEAAMVQETNGRFYGTAYQGGAHGDGTVFSLSVGLGPFVETQPASGKVGATVKILGTNLTGATSVTFNGTVAMFTVKSKSEITTTVPAGATTGTVQVVTPGGTLSSNIPFTVKP